MRKSQKKRHQRAATRCAYRTVPDYGTQERWQHSGRLLELTEQDGVVTARATEEHVLDVLVFRNWITALHRAAAFRFKGDFRAARLNTYVGANYKAHREPFCPFRTLNQRTNAEEAAYQRWREAVQALGMRCSDSVISVACHDLTPRDDQGVLLREGLEALVKHYQAKAKNPPSPHQTVMSTKLPRGTSRPLREARASSTV